ncbi:MAG: DUF255 domain-containing protein [Planctomycetota bacterium]|jgi:hypothetical protein
MQRLCLFVSLLLLAVPAVAEEVKVEAEWKTLDFSDRSNPPPVRTSSSTLDIQAQPPAGAPKLPEGLTAQGYVSFDLRGKTIHVVLAKSAPDATEPDRVASDRNGDGQFGEGEVETVTVDERKRRDGSVGGHGILLRDVDLSLDDRSYRAYFVLQRPVDGEWTFRLITFWYLEGTVALGDKQYIVDVVDNDQDGSFEGPKDLWLVRGTEPVQRSASPLAMSAPGEGRYLDGKRFVLQTVKGMRVALAFAEAAGPDPKDDAQARTRVEHLWAERFDKKREDFVKRHSLDTSRPRAKDPIRWRYITFAEAKALAAKERKALFVDIMAFWCHWCYRMDYYTYIDAEVAGLLNEKFIAVKIIQEQDRAGDYKTVRDELGARGIPAMGIWGPDGTLRRFIGGWKKPEDFLTELRAGLETEDKPDG